MRQTLVCRRAVLQRCIDLDRYLCLSEPVLLSVSVRSAMSSVTPARLPLCVSVCLSMCPECVSVSEPVLMSVFLPPQIGQQWTTISSLKEALLEAKQQLAALQPAPSYLGGLIAGAVRRDVRDV